MSANAPLTLSRSRLADFLACARRFQLRAVERIPWPQPPLSPADEARFGRGRQFHQLLQRHFLGLPVDAGALNDKRLRGWWQAFRNAPLPVHGAQNGRLLPELTLTVPLGGHLLHGRFDLLLLHETDDGPAAHIFDWKTGRPPAGGRTTLQEDWQTRLYLALLAESGRALAPLPATAVGPDRIQLTYWFVADPQNPITFRYDAAAHARSWNELRAMVTGIDTHLHQDGIWPLTPDLDTCRSCAYQMLCDRQAAGQEQPSHHEDEPPPHLTEMTALEPDLP